MKTKPKTTAASKAAGKTAKKTAARKKVEKRTTVKKTVKKAAKKPVGKQRKNNGRDEHGRFAPGNHQGFKPRVKKKVEKKATVKKTVKKAFDKLNQKQQMFVLHYLETFNATKAAISAGYSKKTAYSIGWENLRKPEIADAISELLEEKGITADRIKIALARIAFSGDLADFEELGRGITLQTLRKDGVDTTLLKKVKIRKTVMGGDEEEAMEVVVTDIELRDRIGALKELVRVKGMATENRNVEIKDNRLKMVFDDKVIGEDDVYTKDD